MPVIWQTLGAFAAKVCGYSAHTVVTERIWTYWYSFKWEKMYRLWHGTEYLCLCPISCVWWLVGQVAVRASTQGAAAAAAIRWKDCASRPGPTVLPGQQAAAQWLAGRAPASLALWVQGRSGSSSRSASHTAQHTQSALAVAAFMCSYSNLRPSTGCTHTHLTLLHTYLYRLL